MKMIYSKIIALACVLSFGVATQKYSQLFGQSAANLEVYVNDRVVINRDIFGINNEWEFITDEMFPSFANIVSNNNLGVMRFPGGWESEFYDWETNTTPNWKLTPEVPGASVETLKANVDNYAIVVPTAPAMRKIYGTSDWETAVSELKLIAEDAINRANPEIIKTVEIGNEWWRQWAGGVSRDEKLVKYSKTAMKIAGYIDSQFPDRTFKILINGKYTAPEDFSLMKDNFTESYDVIDGIALHTPSGYDTDEFHIDDLGSNIIAAANSFNSEKELFIYCSEWLPARSYNYGHKHMEAANLLPEIFHQFARNGIDAASYWPAIDGTTVMGLGLIRKDISRLTPMGQIFAEMAHSYKGEVVKTISDEVKITGAISDDQEDLVLFITGRDNPKTEVTVNIHDFDVDHVKLVLKFRPADYDNPDKNAPVVTEYPEIQMNSPNVISFVINSDGPYEIFKIELSNSPPDASDEPVELVDFETPINVLAGFGATFDVVENPLQSGLNTSEHVGQIGRTSTNWYELIDIPSSFNIPPGETKYVHVMVLYASQPDLMIRMNQVGNEGNISPWNSYTDLGQWQDMVFEVSGGNDGKDVEFLRFTGDCGFANEPSGFVLNNEDQFGLIDEIVISNDPRPRSVPTSIHKTIESKDFLLYTSKGAIHFESLDNREKDIEIYDFSGRLIQKINKSQFRYQIAVPGVYIVKVGNVSEKVLVH